MPRVTCTMQIVAHRLGWAGRRWCRRASHKVMLEVRFWTTFPYRGGAKPSQMVRWQTKDWPYGRCPALGHPRIVASEAWDRSLSPWFGTRPASLLAALFLIAAGAAITLCLGPMGQVPTKHSLWVEVGPRLC